VWWCILVIPALEKLKQKDYVFEVSLDYMARLSKKKKDKENSLNNFSYSQKFLFFAP
jgi:hypothetical protein